MSDNIKVAIKVRPLIDREKEESLQWTVNGNTITPTDSKRRVEAGFQFDHIFDMQKKNDVIFNSVVKPIVNSAVNGFNGTVFAYGQTGSGKTYTMMGTEMERGIIPLAIHYMFDAIENTTGREFLIRFSYFEIYNEKINDLLDVKNSDLKIKEENGRVFVNNCSETVTNSPKHMLTVMQRGEKNRSIGETNMNERSSRSHTIFKITIESREISSDSDGAIQISQLNLVDLAGSERASQTGATGDRFKEGKHINLSLSTLGLVIKQLSESQDKDKPNFVNFRDSKLTRILQASLGGNSLTAIICTVTPATFDETYCTLSFASRAKSIKNKPELNEDLSDEALLKRYKKQIIELTKELEKAKETIKDRQNNMLAERVELLKEYIVTGNKKKNIRRRSCPVRFDYDNTFVQELPTIRESLSPETPKIEKIDKIKRRQSIIQNVEMSNDSFQTALADFEIELLHADLSPNDEFYIATRRPLRSRVKFNDDVHVFDDTGPSTRDDPSSYSSTPIKCYRGNTSSPGTPKSVLRERLRNVIEEHEALCNFILMEKETKKQEIQSINVDNNEETLQSLKKSLEDSSNLYSDVNTKYSDLQTEHSKLMEECKVLRKQVESLTVVQNRLGRMEIENKELADKLDASLKRQNYLESENLSQTYQIEAMQAKFKARERELEESLEIAWKERDKIESKEATTEILCLQNLVKKLTEELEISKMQEVPVEESNPLTSEIESLKEKLEETNKLLMESDSERALLVERLDSISQRTLIKFKIEEYDKLLANLEEEKMLSLGRFDELSKELERGDSGLEISMLQKAVGNLSSYIMEFERGDIDVKRKLSVSLAWIEFLCQQNLDKISEDQLDLSLNVNEWKKKITYDEKEKSDIIIGLQKFKDSVIRKSRSIESGFGSEGERSNVNESLDLKIQELTEKLENSNLEKQRLESELEKVRKDLLEVGEKWKDNENYLLKLKITEDQLEQLNARFEYLQSENAKLKLKLKEATEKLMGFKDDAESLNSERQSDLELEDERDELKEMKLKIKKLEAQNSEEVSKLSEALKKLSNYENESDNIEKIMQLTKELEEAEKQNHSIKSKLSDAEEKLIEISSNSSKSREDFEAKFLEKEAEISDLIQKLNKAEENNTEHKLKLEQIEQELSFYERLHVGNSRDEFLTELKKKEEAVKILTDRSDELDRINSEIQLQLANTVEKLQNYENIIRSLLCELGLEGEQLSDLPRKLKELQEENTRIKSKLKAADELENDKAIEINLDSRVEEKEAEVSHLSLKVKEFADENFELKSKIGEFEEMLKNNEELIETLNSKIENFNEKLKEKEIEIAHLNSRCEELKNMNYSFIKSSGQSINNTNEETFADLKSGVDFVETYLAENDAIKKRLEDFEKNVSIFRENVDEQLTFVEGLEKTDINKDHYKDSTSVRLNVSTPNEIKKSTVHNTLENSFKSLTDEADFTSIFNNESYFEKMEVSESGRTTIDNVMNDESQELTAPSIMINVLKSNDIGILRKRIRELEIRNTELDNIYKELMEKVNYNGNEELMKAVEDFKNERVKLKIENAKLAENLQLKIQESEEIKNGIHGLNKDIGKLQNIICLLNTENVDLTCKLNAEKEKNKGSDNSSEELVNELKTQISRISEGKKTLEEEIVHLNEKLNALHSISSITDEDQMKRKLMQYHEKIDILETENGKLTTDLIDKIKELDSIKVCRALQYDHECSYKDKNKVLTEENVSLQNEITDLSDDLMRQIDESEMLKHELEIALKKLEIYENTDLDKTVEQSENLQEIIKEKKYLEAEIIELKGKVMKLTSENTEFTSNLSVIYDELEKSSKAENTCENSSWLSASFESQSRRVSINWKMDQNIQMLNERIRALEEEVQHLTVLNTKLSDLKLTSCSQCAHLKELNENRRALKLEVKTLNNKLGEIQTKFNENFANAEALKLKVNEEFNTSNVTLNSSLSDVMNITLLEDNIRTLNNDKENLKEEYEKVASLYHDKCFDLEALQENKTQNITCPNIVSPLPVKKKEARLHKVESAIKQVGADLHQQREKLLNVANELEKYKGMKEELKIAQESLITAEEKVKLFEGEIASLYDNIKALNSSESALKNEIINVEVNFENLKSENEENKKVISELQLNLNELNVEKNSLNLELQVVKEEREKVLKQQKYEDSNCKILKENIREYEEKIENLEMKIKEISSNLDISLRENQDLKNEITRLESQIKNNAETLEINRELNINKIEEELNSARLLIIKEMKSLTANVQDFSNKSVSDIFQVFLKNIMSKEHEVMKALKDQFDMEKVKLEDEKQQSLDAEKRANTWAKTLENDIEKLQSDLTLLENKNVDLRKEIVRDEGKLDELQHENQGLRDKISIMEIDYNVLQSDFDKKCNENSNQDNIANVRQERERLQALIKDREMELQVRMKQDKENYNKRLEELMETIRNYELKNVDLKSSVEGLEINERKLKDIIDMKFSEIAKNNQKIRELELQLQQLEEINEKLNNESLSKDRHIEEITSLLKIKCDNLSEYKTKLETIMPEYNNLKIQIEERKFSIDKYKSEIESLRVQCKREMDSFKDKVIEEEIKSSGLVNQLSELNEKNGNLLKELESVREKCLELQTENERLEKKVRNSTSKLRVEKDMEVLIDKNRTLENNLEGASNRIIELQEVRTKAMIELADLKGKVESVKRENEELKMSVDALKSRHGHPDIIELRGKYEELLQEKNRIRLELEDKKVLLTQRDQKIEKLMKELNEITAKNKELDLEAEELAEEIRVRGKENAILEDENLSLKEKLRIETEELRSQLKNSIELNTDLRGQIEIIRRSELGKLQRENIELGERVNELEIKVNGRSSDSSRSASPLVEVNKRKKRRSDLFNKKRNLDQVSDSGLSSSSIDCQCLELRKTVANLEKEIVMKNGVIAALNVQIQSENFPYERKCKDLQDELTLQKNKTRQLLQQISNLKKAMLDTSVQECKICKNWKLNQRHQEVQCKMEEKIYLSGTSSGIVGEFKYIEKLEKEKALMRQLCRSRLAQIKQLESKVKELTSQNN